MLLNKLLCDEPELITAIINEMMGSDQNNSNTTDTSVDSFVGISDLPNKAQRKFAKKGFEFCLMVVGESGLGKSTLINSLFYADIYSNEYPGSSDPAKQTVEVETTKVVLKEKSMNLFLTIVDTPGFGTAIDNSNCWQPIVNYIENRYEEYLTAETRVHRTPIQDNRVHCCLYFISPSGRSLKPNDVQVMLHLHDKVNLIPIIAKADTMTPEECLQFKKIVMEDIMRNKIKIYEFPVCESEELNNLKSRVPFAVIGSNHVMQLNGERRRARKYRWGVVDIEDLDCSDFVALRNLLIRHHMLDLVDTTNDVHYENYRCQQLCEPQWDEMLEEINAREVEMRQEMELKLEKVFEEKYAKLKDIENELNNKYEDLSKIVENQRNDLNESLLEFEKIKKQFESSFCGNSKESENFEECITEFDEMNETEYESILSSVSPFDDSIIQ